LDLDFFAILSLVIGEDIHDFLRLDISWKVGNSNSVVTWGYVITINIVILLSGSPEEKYSDDKECKEQYHCAHFFVSIEIEKCCVTSGDLGLPPSTAVSWLNFLLLLAVASSGKIDGGVYSVNQIRSNEAPENEPGVIEEKRHTGSQKVQFIGGVTQAQFDQVLKNVRFSDGIFRKLTDVLPLSGQTFLASSGVLATVAGVPTKLALPCLIHQSSLGGTLVGSYPKFSQQIGH
jgi:hypothetical protein